MTVVEWTHQLCVGLFPKHMKTPTTVVLPLNGIATILACSLPLIPPLQITNLSLIVHLANNLAQFGGSVVSRYDCCHEHSQHVRYMIILIAWKSFLFRAIVGKLW